MCSKDEIFCNILHFIPDKPIIIPKEVVYIPPKVNCPKPRPKAAEIIEDGNISIFRCRSNVCTNCQHSEELIDCRWSSS